MREPKTKTRLDRLLVERELAPNRETARRLILAGKVFVGGERSDKPGREIDAAAPIDVRAPPSRYVSRGGLKLEGALDAFGLTPREGALALDIGASTGGFTDCLLQRGVGRVIAVDVGRGQIHERLRVDPRVALLERTNARTLTLEAIGGRPVDLTVIDVSFISLRLILPACLELSAPGGRVVALIKPQFEAGRGQVGSGGVVRDPAVHRRVLEDFFSHVARSGWIALNATPSPLRGADGNLEFFALLARRSEVAEAPEIDVEGLSSGAYNQGVGASLTGRRETRPPKAAPLPARSPTSVAKTTTTTALAPAPTRPMILIEGNPAKAGVRQALRAAIAWMKRSDVEPIVSPSLAPVAPRADVAAEAFAPERLRARAAETSPDRGLVLTLGGDGALLHAVRRHLELGLPFAGVNLGAVGFNSTIDPDALPAALDRWREGRAEYEERFTVEARLHRVAGGIERAVALNEVLFSRRSAQQLVRIELRQGESLVLRLHADGIIIATPTGSTAHSLSAGGPVVHPALRSFVVTGLAPYSLSHRPIALPPEPSLRLRWTTRAEEAPCAIALDGQEHWPTEPGDELEMAAGPPVRLIRGEGADYFDSLRKKLNWCDSIRPIEG